MTKRIVVTALLERGQFSKLTFDPKLLAKMRQGVCFAEKPTPPMGGGVSYKQPRYYRGKSNLENQSRN